ncbi:FAD-dependent oxidoreductase [Rubneribacter sp.]|nr:FAD-binding protein [Candidatus Rubneribacter avistercoris]
MDKRSLLSRRNFIKTGSALALGTAALGLAGCAGAPAANTANDAATSPADIEWDEEFDVVVVGAGAAGLATAAAMATEGEGLTTLLLEKGAMPTGSGNSPVCSGSFHITDDPDNFALYVKALVEGFTCTPESMYEVYAQGAAENWEWLTGLGMLESDVKITPQAGKAEYYEIEHHDAFSKCQFNADNTDRPAHISIFLSEFLDQHPDAVTRHTNTPLTALVQDPQTRAVLGGVYEKSGKSVYVKARRGVVMCCGGFENDPEMLQDYLSFERMHAAGATMNTGDGHRICAKLGASMWHMNSFAGAWSNGISIDGEKMMAYRTLKKAQGIVVGVNGRRFYQEWEGTTMFTPGEEGPLELHYGCRHGHQNFGGDWRCLPLPPKQWFIFDSEGLRFSAYLGANSTSNTLQNQTETTENDPSIDPVADGYAYIADTVEDLAVQIGVPVDELTNTVNRWNASCDNGEDEQFHRPADQMTPVRTPPFYAIECIPEILNTDGGPRRNEKAQIIDVDGEPIPNLYSSGEFGSIWASKYQGSGNITECMVFGRIAARELIAKE